MIHSKLQRKISHYVYYLTSAFWPATFIRVIKNYTADSTLNIMLCRVSEELAVMTYIQFRFSTEAKRVGHGRNHEPCIAKLAQHSVKKQELDMSIIVFLYCARIMIIGKKDVHILMMKNYSL